MIIERHTSPDGLINLIVDVCEDGEITDYGIGLEGFASHTHGDILAELRGLPGKEAIREYIDEILNDERIFVVSRVAGKVRDIWITDGDLESELKYKPDEEELEFRFWSGKNVS
jgi:hypothetical protein